jgi:hypothetical protein
MTLDYHAPAPSANTKHDHIYTTLLGVLAMFLVMAMLTLNSLRQRPTIDAEAKTRLLLPLSIEGCYLGAVVVVLFVRLVFPAYRRWPTLGLNLFLLLFVPFGTALAIYGLWKVDKRLADPPRDPTPLPPPPPSPSGTGAV